MNKYTVEELDCIIEATECRIEEAKADGDMRDSDLESELEHLRDIRDSVAADAEFP